MTWADVTPSRPFRDWLASAAALLLCLTALACVLAPASAQAGVVSWKSTCNVATSTYRDRILTARCNGSSRPSSLNTAQCRSGPLPSVVSYGGKLYCHYLSDHEVSGTYIKSCFAVHATGRSYTYNNPQTGQSIPEFAPTQITASCVTGNGARQTANLYPTSSPPWGTGFFCGDIANENGRLVCTPVPKQASGCADPSSTTVCSGGVGANEAGSYPPGWSPSDDTQE